ncbi:MAG: putative photosynthetic complex assembly protein PuhE [Panacagrimonas sp.]
MTLSTHGLPILFTLFLWWFSTGAILYLDGLPRRTFRWSLAGASVVLICALYALSASATDTGASAAYCAFACALLVWGWLEMSFLMGFVTGPRTTACPPGSSGWRRVAYAIEAILYHEIALLLGALTIAVLTWEAPNQLGLETFVILWISRQSAKLNVFFGARNLSEEFLPDHLRYLQSYFARRPMNLLFPVSVTVGTIGAVVLWQLAFADGIPDADAIGLSFLATLLTLATIEHWFLMLPIPSNALWDWGLRSRRQTMPRQSPDRKIEARAL